MNRLFKTLIAGYGAKKLGGGCFSTIIIFILIYWALGTCNRPAQRTGQGHLNPPPAITRLAALEQEETIVVHPALSTRCTQSNSNTIR